VTNQEADMGMRVHELHAAMVHGPLAILPTAAAVDLAASITGNRHQARFGRQLWWVGAGSGLLAGVAGMAASQEVKSDGPRTSDMIWLHGIGNLGLVLGAIGMVAWRRSHPPSKTQATLGLVACGLSLYTAYLGGEMVYGHGIGVRAMPGYVATGVDASPPVLSRAAPATFVRDAFEGLRWLVGRTWDALAGRKPIDRGAFGVEAPRAAAELDV
jgi:uncharacterized membrane protein